MDDALQRIVMALAGTPGQAAAPKTTPQASRLARAMARGRGDAKHAGIAALKPYGEPQWSNGARGGTGIPNDLGAFQDDAFQSDAFQV